jgi:integrase
MDSMRRHEMDQTPESKLVSTDAEIRALTCPEGSASVEYSLREPRLPGLTLRVYPAGRKVFFLVYRFNRERRRLKLGLYSPPGFGLAAARLAAGAKLAAITMGADPAATVSESRRAIDVRALYEQFELEVVRRFPPKTQVNWSGTSRRFLAEIGSLPLTATDEICDRVMVLHKRIGFQEKKEALAHTLFRQVARFFRWAIEERKLKPSQFPLSGMRSRFKDKKRTRYFDPDEIASLFRATNNPTTWWPEGVKPDKVNKRDKHRAAIHRCYFLLLWYVGCRRGALASLRWDEIKPDHTNPEQWIWYRPTSKNTDPLEVPLSSHAVKVLDELRTLTGDAGYVFQTQRKDGTTGHRSESWKAVTRLQKSSGVEDFTNHAVRKTVSTYMTRTLDVPTDVVTAILNHRLLGPKANENYIQALPVRRMREALDVWARHLDELVGRTRPDSTLNSESIAQARRAAPRRSTRRRRSGRR